MVFSLFILVILSSAFGHDFTLLPKEVCLLQVDEGPCLDDVKRYYYNTITQKCEEFSYGGCMGNQNNFGTFEKCQKTCWRIPKVPRVCRKAKDEGPCRALHERYFFNMTTMTCEQFFYGGCKGNENRFIDEMSCMEYCRPQKGLTAVPLLCLGPLDRGTCSASITRYYYNSASKMCEEFVYSGCGGSSNNFVSKQSCTDVCGKGGKPFRNTKQAYRLASGNRVL